MRALIEENHVLIDNLYDAEEALHNQSGLVVSLGNNAVPFGVALFPPPKVALFGPQFVVYSKRKNALKIFSTKFTCHRRRCLHDIPLPMHGECAKQRVRDGLGCGVSAIVPTFWF